MNSQMKIILHIAQKCETEIFVYYDDETVYCKECGFRFGVVECREE